MELSLTTEGKRARIQILGDIDGVGAEDLKTCFIGLDTYVIKEVVLDFEKVHYIGSAGIGKLLLLYKDLAVQGGTIRIEKVCKQVFDLLKIVKLDTIFTICQA